MLHVHLLLHLLVTCTKLSRSSTRDRINLLVNLGWRSLLCFGEMKAVQWGMVGTSAVSASLTATFLYF